MPAGRQRGADIVSDVNGLEFHVRKVGRNVAATVIVRIPAPRDQAAVVLERQTMISTGRDRDHIAQARRKVVSALVHIVGRGIAPRDHGAVGLQRHRELLPD